MSNRGISWRRGSLSWDVILWGSLFSRHGWPFGEDRWGSGRPGFSPELCCSPRIAPWCPLYVVVSASVTTVGMLSPFLENALRSFEQKDACRLSMSMWIQKAKLQDASVISTKILVFWFCPSDTKSCGRVTWSCVTCWLTVPKSNRLINRNYHRERYAGPSHIW